MCTFASRQRPSHQTKSGYSKAHGRGTSAHNCTAGAIFQLQPTIGNQAVQRLLQTNPEGLQVESDTTVSACFAIDLSRIPVNACAPVQTQTKLTINPPGDVY